MGCPHCEALKIFDVDNPREYWLMTEMFVYLHGSDECNHNEDTRDKNFNKDKAFIISQLERISKGVRNDETPPYTDVIWRLINYIDRVRVEYED